MRRGISSLIASFCFVLLVGVAAADERSEALDREATHIYQQVFSPFCPGRSLNDCPSSKATELKHEVRAKLEAGVPTETILEEVFQKYGDQYRAVPVFAGVGVFVWLVPLAFVVIGLLMALCVAKGKRKTISVGPRLSTNMLSEEEQRRVQEELSKLD